MIKATMDIPKMKRILRIYGKTAYPDAVAAALNETARAVEKAAKRNAKKKFVIRTPYTLNSIKVDRTARGTNVNAMYARVGSVSPYLGDHDEGESYPERETLPTIAARKWNYSNKVVNRWRHNKIGQFTTKYQGSGSAFMGKPRGSGNRPFGIWIRHNANKRLTLIKFVTSKTPKVKGNRWFSDPVRKFGSIEFTRDRFIKAAQRTFDKVK